MLIKNISIFLVSFFLGIIFITLLNKLTLNSKRFRPKDIPLIGGIAIGSAFLISSVFGFYIYSFFFSSQIIGVMFSSLVMLIWGIIDDVKELSVTSKFLTQIIATSILVFSGIKTQIIFFNPIINLIITFIWVLAITNAFNHLDVMDGLASGTAIIIGLSFFVIAYLNRDLKSIVLSLSLVGAIFGFLIYNLPPAKIYMGNAGSHFLGFVLSTVALIISYATEERKLVLFTPLLILGLPIFDTTFLILMRLKQHKSIFKKSNDHLALRFLSLGYSKIKVLSYMLLLGLFFSLCGLALVKTSIFLEVLIILIAILIGALVFYRMGNISVTD